MGYICFSGIRNLGRGAHRERAGVGHEVLQIGSPVLAWASTGRLGIVLGWAAVINESHADFGNGWNRVYRTACDANANRQRSFRGVRRTQTAVVHAR